MGILKIAPLTVQATSMGLIEENVAGIGVRWHDAWGDASKEVFSNNTPASVFTATLVGTTPTFVPSATAGQLYTITTAATEYSGVNGQVTGEPFILTSGKPLKVYGKFALSDATQSDFLFGICETLTALLNDSSSHAIASSNVEGIFFCKLDGATDITANCYKDGASTGSSTVGTMDTSAHVYEINWDGTKASCYFDGGLVATFSSGLPDGDLTLSFCVRAGEAAAKTFTIYNGLSAIQAR